MRQRKMIFAGCAGGLVLFIAVWLFRRVDQANQVHLCASNLQALGDSLLLFANDHNGHYPDHLGDLCADQPGLSPALFVVPWGSARAAGGATAKERAEQIPGHCSYVYLGAGRTVSNVGADDLLIFVADGISPTGKIYCLCGCGRVDADDEWFVIQSVITMVTRLRPAALP